MSGSGHSSGGKDRRTSDGRPSTTASCQSTSLESSPTSPWSTIRGLHGCAGAAIALSHCSLTSCKCTSNLAAYTVYGIRRRPACHAPYVPSVGTLVSRW